MRERGSGEEPRDRCDSLIKAQVLSWVQTPDLRLDCTPTYRRKFFKFRSHYWSSGIFLFLGGISGNPTFSQAHVFLAILRWGGRFSCRQIIHGDFVLNEVKLLLSAKPGFQKSQPGLQLLPFFYCSLPLLAGAAG